MSAVVEKLSGLSWLKRQRDCGPIGLHFGPRDLQLVQLKETGSRLPVVSSAVSMPLPFARSQLLQHGDAASRLIRASLHGRRFSRRRVVSAMPPDTVRIISLSYPEKNGDDANVIAGIMQERLDGPLSDYVLDYMPIRDTSRDGEKLALVASARRVDVMAYLEILANAGLDVQRLEVGPVAILRVIETLAEDFEGIRNSLAINTGVDASYLTMMSGHRLLSDQKSEFCEQALLTLVARTLDISTSAALELIMDNGLDPKLHEQAPIVDIEKVATSETLAQILKPAFLSLVNDAEHAFLYASSESHGDAEKQVYLLGSITRWPGVLELLRQCSKTPVDILSQSLKMLLPAHATSEAERPGLNNNLIIPMGLALHPGERHA